jgi:hypothetical protein
MTKPGISLHGFVVTDGDVYGFFAADDYYKFLSVCDTGVEKITLQHYVMSHHQRGIITTAEYSLPRGL